MYRSLKDSTRWKLPWKRRNNSFGQTPERSGTPYQKFEEEPELEILNGRYGPYITYKGSNYKIPKDIVPQDLSLQSCLELIKIQDEKGETSSFKRGKRTTKKK